MSAEGWLRDEWEANKHARICRRCSDLDLEECECDPEEGVPTEPEDLPDDFLQNLVDRFRYAKYDSSNEDKT